MRSAAARARPRRLPPTASLRGERSATRRARALPRCSRTASEPNETGTLGTRTEAARSRAASRLAPLVTVRRNEHVARGIPSRNPARPGSPRARKSSMDCDTVVIGSGIGGLTAALALARAGQRVRVLEQHYLPGGWTHSFTLEGHTFSPGVHYLGELEEGANLRRFFEGLGVGRHLSFRELAPDGYDHLLVAGERYDVPKGREQHEERMKRRFPRDAAGIDRYFKTCRRIAEELERAGDLLSVPALVRAPFRLPTLSRWGFARLDSLFDACGIDDPMARAFLSARCGNHGLPPKDVSLPAHAVMIQHYMNGAYYPVGGARRIPAAFLKELRARGGTIELRTRVSEILVERGRAVGVKRGGGETIRSRHVVSNAAAALTY